MTFYHESKSIAVSAGEELLGPEWTVRAELEPNNGWVAVVAPVSLRALMDLSSSLPSLLERVEIDLSALSRLRTRPAEHRALPPIETVRAARSVSSAAPDNSVITVLVSQNPKRPGSKSHARFEHYETGITVDEFVRRGGTIADVKHDTSKNFIKLEAFSGTAS